MVNLATSSRVTSKKWKSCVKLRVNPHSKLTQNFVQNQAPTQALCKTTTFSQLSSLHSTTFFTTHPPLYLNYLFHNSTAPTITTIIYK